MVGRPLIEQRRFSGGRRSGWYVWGFVDLDAFTGSEELAWFFGRALSS